MGREPYWWERGVGLDPVELDDDTDQAAEDVAAGLELTIGNGCAPVMKLYGSEDFPCLADDADEVDAETLALAREVVRRFNGFPLLLASLKSLLRLQNQERGSVDVEKDLCAVVEKFTGG